MNEDEHGSDAMQKCGTWAIHFDVHMEGEVSDSGGCPNKKLKLESTDVILSSSHAKKLASFLPEFRLWTE